jgi:hypothetical protein
MAARGSSKYSSTGNYKLAHILVPSNTVPYSSELTTKANMCITAALSKSTWAKYCSAWNAFKKFEKSVHKNFEWPLQEKLIQVSPPGALWKETFHPAPQKHTSQHSRQHKTYQGTATSLQNLVS